MPRGTNAPKLWPAEPVKPIWIVLSGSPAPPYRLVSSWPSIVPTVRLTLRIGSCTESRSPRSSAGAASEISVLSSAGVQPVVLRLGAVQVLLPRRLRLVQDRRQVEPARLPVTDRLVVSSSSA
jgi:hypothetical protein